jgi:hypothetical protein
MIFNSSLINKKNEDQNSDFYAPTGLAFFAFVVLALFSLVLRRIIVFSPLLISDGLYPCSPGPSAFAGSFRPLQFRAICYRQISARTICLVVGRASVMRLLGVFRCHLLSLAQS